MMARFQSTPANFTAGDALCMPAAVFRSSFNPRPPISQRATSSVGSSPMASTMFQSTPANFTAGDRRCTATATCASCFNPRPPISQRATRRDTLITQPSGVSIHARQFHSGRRADHPSGCPGSSFQSTPANFTAGDDSAAHVLDAVYKFQSTPANFTAGDPAPDAGRQRPGLVSIHARQFHSGRLMRSRL